MRKLVIDSSIVIKWFTPEPQSAYARSLLVEYQVGRLVLIAPDLIISEIANALWWKQSTQRFAADDGRVVLETFYNLHMTLFPTSDLIDQAYWLATRTQQSVLDTLYVALARREKCRYVTADEQFVEMTQKALPEVTALTAWK